MRIALVHDWLISYSGAERVLEQILYLFKDADIYTVIDYLPINFRDFLMNKKVNTTFIQNLPFANKKYRSYLPLMPLAIEQFDLSKYDLIISSSHAVAKGVLTGPNQLHISYVHSPIRYAWDLQHQYLSQSGLNQGIRGYIAKIILHKIRLWDYRTANGVDYFIANSNFIARRIWKIYRRDAKVIYPPVDIENFTLCENKENFYLTASRMVPYKKIDIIIKAFSDLPDKKLIVIGEGPDFPKLKKIASKNVELLGYQPFHVLKHYMQKAKAFIFAAEEDFGITPVEAQACGTPVIAFGKGGALETIRGINENNPTGVFFYNQRSEDIIKAINLFEDNNNNIQPQDCRNNSLRFSTERFRSEFKAYVNEQIKVHFA